MINNISAFEDSKYYDMPWIEYIRKIGWQYQKQKQTWKDNGQNLFSIQCRTISVCPSEFKDLALLYTVVSF